jgi:Zn-dependent metalloprotease
VRIEQIAPDYFGRERYFACEQLENPEARQYFEDTELKVRTCYIKHGSEAFPGRSIVNPPPWQPQSVSAHANASDVARFFNDLLEYPSEEATVRYFSSIHCFEDQSNHIEHKYACWSKRDQQAYFGQCMVNGQLRCLAVAPDIVAHEFTHALTSWTAGLEYRFESGALDESYADIFGILIANSYNSDIKTWNWEIGGGFGEEGCAFRDLQHPSKYHSRFRINGELQRFPHPAHMNDFLHLQYNQDYGGVHHNCSIHNHAAYKLITSEDEQTGEKLFDAKTAAALFYRALTQLSPESGFIDSRRAIENVAKTLFRRDAAKEKKLRAIATAFDQVGIKT